MKHILLTGLLAVLLIPGTANAYVEPEDVLYQNENDTVIGTSSSSSKASVSSDDGLHGAAPEPSGLTPREERILERIGQNQSAVYQPGQQPQEEVLHSGAPLAHTGPETVFALALLAVAVGTTPVFPPPGPLPSRISTS